MMNKNLVENILKEYCMLKNRIALVERLQDKKCQVDNGVSINNSIVSIKGKCIVDSRVKKQNAMIRRLVENVDNIERELSRLYKSINIVDEALIILRVINENYYMIIHEHFIKNIRIEDLEDVFCLSRSRCYELRKRAIEELTVIIFGKL